MVLSSAPAGGWDPVGDMQLCTLQVSTVIILVNKHILKDLQFP